MTDATTVRLSYGASRLRRMMTATDSLIISWRPGREAEAEVMEWDASEVSMTKTLGDDAGSYITLQAFRCDNANCISETADELQTELNQSNEFRVNPPERDLPTINEEGEPDDTWILEQIDILDAMQEEEYVDSASCHDNVYTGQILGSYPDSVGNLFHTLAAYTPGLLPTMHVEPYAHYYAAGFDIS